MIVIELIAKLQEFPATAKVVIDDADTNWYLNLQQVDFSEDIVVLNGDYNNEYSKEDE